MADWIRETADKLQKGYLLEENSDILTDELGNRLLIFDELSAGLTQWTN